MVTVFGIEFAPLRIPLQRRLQTLAVFQWTLSFLLLGPTCLVLMMLLACSQFYAIPLLYGAWYVYDWHTTERGGRPCQWVRSWQLWKYFRDYFPVKLIKTADLDPRKNYILGIHPHGIMCDGAFCNFATEATGYSKMFPGITPFLITINYQFFFPLHREYFMSAGACSCSLESMKYILTKKGVGNALALVVGGAYESLEAKPGSRILNLSRRKGFIRLALEHGASLVPVFSFGENDIFQQASNPPGSRLRKLQLMIAKYAGFAAPLFYGRGVFNYTFGLVPYRRPITTVVGRPIDVKQTEQPSNDQVDDLQKQYIRQLVALFEEYKLSCGLQEADHLVIQ